MRQWLFLLALPLLAQKLTVLPPSVELTGPEERQQLIVEGVVGEHQEDWTRTARWSISPNGRLRARRSPSPRRSWWWCSG